MFLQIVNRDRRVVIPPNAKPKIAGQAHAREGGGKEVSTSLKHGTGLG
jgi:hypothetical protein